MAKRKSRNSRTSGGGNNYDTKIRNPNKNETNKQFIKVNAWEVLKRRA